MLAECGFDPGPADGAWGARTDRAATAYVQAHGGSPASGDRPSLIAQVEDLRTGEQGPCPAGSQTAGGPGACSVAGHKSVLSELMEPLIELTKAAAAVEDTYERLTRNAELGGNQVSVVVGDLEQLEDKLFAARSKLDRNNLDHWREQEETERGTMRDCIDDHYKADRVASSCSDELSRYRRTMRSVTALAEDMIRVMADASSAGGAITIGASTLWPTSAIRTNVVKTDLNTLGRLVRESQRTRSDLESEVQAERQTRNSLYNCVDQTPEY